MTEEQEKREPRAITPEELKWIFMQHMAGLVDYWANADKISGEPMTTQYRLEGLMGSVLSVIDGCAIGLPAFELEVALRPIVDESDKDFAKEENYDWYPDDKPDIAGGLHEVLSQYLKGHVPRPEGFFSFADFIGEQAKAMAALHRRPE